MRPESYIVAAVTVNFAVYALFVLSMPLYLWSPSITILMTAFGITILWAVNLEIALVVRNLQPYEDARITLGLPLNWKKGPPRW